MKVLHVVAGPLNGGAAKGALALHQGLRELGVNSILVNSGKPSTQRDSTFTIVDNAYKKILLSLGRRLSLIPLIFYRKRKRRIFSTGLDGIDITRLKEYKSSDVIHLHFISGILPVRLISKIDKPIVWTIRDMWPFTGGCHYALECTRYEDKCGSCPQLRSKSIFDISRIVLNIKKKSIGSGLIAVGISNWISECASNSDLLKNNTILTIPNAINSTEFNSTDKNKARKELGIKANGRKIILIGAYSLSDFYKGFDLFLDSLKYIRNKEILICFFGHINENEIRNIVFPYISFGYIKDSYDLSIIYSAADVFIAPSRQEAFGKTLVESLCCGTPVVCFDATGPSDIIENYNHGYKAIPFNSKDLAKGVDHILSLNKEESERMSANCRRHALTNFSHTKIANQYHKLYKEIV